MVRQGRRYPQYNSLSIGFSLDDDAEARLILCHYDETGHLVNETHLGSEALAAFLIQVGVQAIGVREMNESIQQILAEQQEVNQSLMGADALPP